MSIENNGSLYIYSVTKKPCFWFAYPKHLHSSKVAKPRSPKLESTSHDKSEVGEMFLGDKMIGGHQGQCVTSTREVNSQFPNRTSLVKVG